MKTYSYLILIMVSCAFAYLVIEFWNSKPGMVVFLGLLAVLILYRELKEIKRK